MFSGYGADSCRRFWNKEECSSDRGGEYFPTISRYAQRAYIPVQSTLWHRSMSIIVPFRVRESTFDSYRYLSNTSSSSPGRRTFWTISLGLGLDRRHHSESNHRIRDMSIPPIRTVCGRSLPFHKGSKSERIEDTLSSWWVLSSAAVVVLPSFFLRGRSSSGNSLSLWP